MTTTNNEAVSDLEYLRARVTELEQRDAQNRRELNEKAIEHAVRLVRERDEREAAIAAERAKAERVKLRPRPTTWGEYSALTTAEKAEAVGLYGEAVVIECLRDKVRNERRIRDEEAARKLANAKPLYNR